MLVAFLIVIIIVLICAHSASHGFIRKLKRGLRRCVGALNNAEGVANTTGCKAGGGETVGDFLDDGADGAEDEDGAGPSIDTLDTSAMGVLSSVSTAAATGGRMVNTATQKAKAVLESIATNGSIAAKEGLLVPPKVTRFNKHTALNNRNILESLSATAENIHTGTYGGIGNYGEWVAQQSIDDKTRASHSRWVSDNAANGGATISVRARAQEAEPYDPMPWRGLSRPAAVKIGSPDQVPDIDMDFLPKKRAFTFKLS